MKRFACVCGNSLFFENTTCVNCKRAVGWCAGCRKISSFDPHPQNGFVCADPKCRAHVLKCDNYFTHNVCNRTVPVGTAGNPAYCDYCRFNHTIPDLSVAGNQAKWARLEAAKRRTLYDFDDLAIPYGTADDGVDPPLQFDFKADTIKADSKYRDIGEGEQVFTGHDNGLITINVREADPVAREKARVEFKEAHRTLIGHFRHELGHYVWDVAIKGKREDECKALFGDHTADYGEAMKAYYANGPKPGWQSQYVSGYATMHPWEDWAETFANYLDMMATLDSAEAGRAMQPLDKRKFDDLASTYVRLGLTLNELTRGIGLVDFLPEVIAEPVRKKMAFVHGLTRYGK
ncbi:MAG TPA: putative zinc-binding metallopeptidase [Humisphaera sp.]